MSKHADGNPILPARPEVLHLAGLDKDATNYTLREAVEWYKNVVDAATPNLRPGAEANAVNQTWMVLVEAIAQREGVPLGLLGHYLMELASQELRLRDQAQADAGLPQ